jgi:hypothetical protein
VLRWSRAASPGHVVLVSEGQNLFRDSRQIWLQPAFFGGANPWFPWYLEMVCRKFPKMEVLWTFPFHFTIRFTSELGISHWASHSISQTCSGNKIDKPTEKSSWLFPFKLP